MTQSLSSRRLNFFKRAVPILALAVSAGFASAPTWAQTTAPRAGTSIGNQATATYNDGSNIPRNVQSNSVTTTVQQVAAVSLTASRNINAAPGAPVAFPHTIQNNGNGTDSFGITLGGFTGFGLNPQIFADANQDGVPDNNTPITSTPSLAPGEKFNFVIVGTVPAGQTAGQTSSLVVTATSVNTPTITDSNTDTVTVSTNAVINVTKSLGGPAAGGVYTYTLRYTNNSNVAASNLILNDVLDARLTYQAGSGRWSQSGTTPLTDAAGGDPAGIDYSFSSNTVSATIASVPARSTGSVSFSVTVAPGTAPSNVPNRATFTYDDDNNAATAPVPGNTNNVDLTVAPAPAVSITNDSKGPVAQGSTVTFTNTVTNGGNGSDVFNITLAPGTTPFPAGTTFQLFQPGGAATLLDSNGDGIPDTGPIAAGASYNVIVKATLPATFSGTGPFVQNVTATSSGPGKPAATGTDTVTSISASAVEITNRDANNNRIGQGALTPAPVLTRAGNPGTIATFPLSANNLSANNDNYALSFSATNPGQTPLPAGFSVVFKNATGQVITNTGNIAPGGFFDYVAEVTIPANATPQEIALFFTITSGASGASDTIRDQLTVNTIAAITITPNNQGQVFPGSSVNYAHVITNNGNATETNIATTTTDTQPGFSSVVYADTNGNGVLDPAEQAAGPLTNIPSLAPGARFPVIVVVFGPSNQFTSGAVNTTTLTGTAASGQTASATDTTTIVAGDVTLTKSQSVNGGASTQGNATALPGQKIRYTILVRNTGGAPVTNIVVSDTTPSFTTYSTTNSAGAADAASYTIGGGAPVPATSAPANGAAGTITWTIPTLNPGEVATVTFNVTINN